MDSFGSCQAPLLAPESSQGGRRSTRPLPFLLRWHSALPAQPLPFSFLAWPVLSRYRCLHRQRSHAA